MLGIRKYVMHVEETQVTKGHPPVSDDQIVWVTWNSVQEAARFIHNHCDCGFTKKNLEELFGIGEA